ncbi:MAG: cupin domain-containing protein [Pirellulales bacterium]|nr:cupin domain-containing protein [Pirellulales bacterium]
MCEHCGCSGSETLEGPVLTLADLAAYQDGAIVSRTLVEKPTGTVTLFAFAQGQALSEHTAPFDALVQVLDGQGEFTIDGRVHQVAAGELLVMPAGRPHSVRAPEPFRMLLTMIRS